METTDSSVNESVSLCQDFVATLNSASQSETSVLCQLKSLSVDADDLADQALRREEEECKECIEELLRRQTVSGGAVAQQRQDILKLEEELKQLEQASQVSSNARDECSESLAECRRRLQLMKDEEARLKAEAKRLGDAVAHDLPFQSQLMKLYLSATKVKFVPDNSASSLARGFVSNPGSVVPFSFDTNDIDRVAITRQLWDMMEEEW